MIFVALPLNGMTDNCAIDVDHVLLQCRLVHVDLIKIIIIIIEQKCFQPNVKVRVAVSNCSWQKVPDGRSGTAERTRSAAVLHGGVRFALVSVNEAEQLFNYYCFSYSC